MIHKPYRPMLIIINIIRDLRILSYVYSKQIYLAHNFKLSVSPFSIIAADLTNELG